MADNSIPTIIPPPSELNHHASNILASMGAPEVPVAVAAAIPLHHHHHLHDFDSEVQPALALHQLATTGLVNTTTTAATTTTTTNNNNNNNNAAESHGHDTTILPDQVADSLDRDDDSDSDDAKGGGKRKRLCRHPGCSRVIKSQGLCQRHGGKAKRCKVPGCDKQAQGTHDGMCKRHWKIKNCAGAVDAAAPKEEDVPPPPEGASVYDSILPQSLAYRPSTLEKHQLEDSNATRDTDNPITPPPELSIMPLVLFLRENAHLEFGWHRNAERRARGMFPCTLLTVPFEPWERQLVSLIYVALLCKGSLHRFIS